MNRPGITKEIIAEAARKLVADNRWEDDQAEDIAAVYERHMNGYELAKALESDCLWDIDAMTVDALDGMDDEVRSIHNAACVEWARENNIQPPHPIGTMTTHGEITGIYEHRPAMYLVRAPGHPDPTRLLVPFEDVRAVETSGA